MKKVLIFAGAWAAMGAASFVVGRARNPQWPFVWVDLALGPISLYNSITFPMANQ